MASLADCLSTAGFSELEIDHFMRNLTAKSASSARSAWSDLVDKESYVFDVIRDFERDVLRELRLVDNAVTGEDTDIRKQAKVLSEYQKEWDIRGLTDEQQMMSKERWDALSESDKRAASPLYRITKELNDLREQTINYNLMVLKRRLGLRVVEMNAVEGDTTPAALIERAKANHIRRNFRHVYTSQMERKLGGITLAADSNWKNNEELAELTEEERKEALVAIAKYKNAYKSLQNIKSDKKIDAAARRYQAVKNADFVVFAETLEDPTTYFEDILKSDAGYAFVAALAMDKPFHLYDSGNDQWYSRVNTKLLPVNTPGDYSQGSYYIATSSSKDMEQKQKGIMQLYDHIENTVLPNKTFDTGIFDVDQNTSEQLIYTPDPARVDDVKNWLYGRMMDLNIEDNAIEALEYLDMAIEVMSNPVKVENLLFKIANMMTINRKVTGSQSVMTPGMFAKNIEVRTVYEEKGPDGRTSRTIQLTNNDDYSYEDGKVKAMKVWLPHYFKEALGDIDMGNIDPSLLKMIGYRIPTQSLSSVEFIEIAGFLPQSAGNMVVVPPSIVTKTGADFDWDKLFTHMYNYIYHKETNKFQRKEFTTNRQKLWNTRKEEFAKEFETVRFTRILHTYYDEVNTIAFNSDIDYKDFKAFAESELNQELPDDLKEAIDFINRNIPLVIVDNQIKVQKTDSRVLPQLLKINSEKQRRLKAARQKRDAALQEIYKELKPIWDGLTLLQQNGIDVMDNMTIDREIELMEMPNRFAEMMSPVTNDIGASRYKDTVNDLGLISEPGTLTDMLDPTYMIMGGANLVQGSNNIGVAARSGVLKINNTQNGDSAGVRMTGLPHRLTSDGRSSYSSMLTMPNKDGSVDYISDMFSEITSGYVDIGNDTFPADANMTGRNAPIVTELQRLGVSAEYIIAYINQPAIVWMNFLRDKNTSDLAKSQLRHLNLKNGTMMVKKALENLIDDMGGEQIQRRIAIRDSVEMRAQYLKNLDRLQNQARIGFDPVKYTDDLYNGWDIMLQYAVVVDYLHMMDHINTSRELQDATVFNTSGDKPNIAESSLMLASVNEAERIRPGFMEQFQRGNYQAPFYSAASNINRMVSSYSILGEQNPFIRSAMFKFAEQILRYRKELTKDERYQLMNAWRKDLVTFLYQTHQNTNTKELESLVLSTIMDEVEGKMVANSNTVPRRLNMLQREMRDPNYQGERNKLIMDLGFTFNNPVVTNMPVGNDGTNIEGFRIDNMFLKPAVGKSFDPADIALYASEYKKLKTTHPVLYKDIFKFLMVQNGLREAPNNFMHVVPAEVVADELAESMMDAQSRNDIHAVFTMGQFMLNNDRKATWMIRYNPDALNAKVFIGDRWYYIASFEDGTGGFIFDQYKLKGRENQAKLSSVLNYENKTMFEEGLHYFENDAELAKYIEMMQTQHEMAELARQAEIQRRRAEMQGRDTESLEAITADNDPAAIFGQPEGTAQTTETENDGTTFIPPQSSSEPETNQGAGWIPGGYNPGSPWTSTSTTNMFGQGKQEKDKNEC